MSILGKSFHLAIDATLFAALLSGIKRQTGLAPNVSLINQPEIENYTIKYLNYGDWVYDQTISRMDSSPFFVRKIW
ncbi:Mco8 protein [Martiniozyma asiatica (nom. inval.)]|nr:Mco8 protein [Martiniozyma asiatica]